MFLKVVFLHTLQTVILLGNHLEPFYPFESLWLIQSFGNYFEQFWSLKITPICSNLRNYFERFKSLHCLSQQAQMHQLMVVPLRIPVLQIYFLCAFVYLLLVTQKLGLPVHTCVSNWFFVCICLPFVGDLEAVFPLGITLRCFFPWESLWSILYFGNHFGQF